MDVRQRKDPRQIEMEMRAVIDTSHRTGGRTDVVMGLFGPDDQTIQVAQDDDSGKGLNARISTSLEPGTYYVRIRHFRPRGTGKYTLSVASS